MKKGESVLYNLKLKLLMVNRAKKLKFDKKGNVHVFFFKVNN